MECDNYNCKWNNLLYNQIKSQVGKYKYNNKKNINTNKYIDNYGYNKSDIKTFDNNM